MMQLKISSLYDVNSVTLSEVADANGNITEYCNSQGSVVAHYEYSPFGQVTFQSGEMADEFAFRYSTKYYCPELNMSDFGMRWYSPEVGRFINRDPIEESGGVMLYGYCGNDGVNGIDVLGQAFVTFWDSNADIEITDYSKIKLSQNSKAAVGGFQCYRQPQAIYDKEINEQKVACKIRFDLEINIGIGLKEKPSKEMNYHYDAHANDGGSAVQPKLGRGTVNVWNKTTKSWAPIKENLRKVAELHELGHAKAYWEYVKPCLEKKLASFEGQPISKVTIETVRAIASPCFDNLEYFRKDVEYSNAGAEEGYKALGLTRDWSGTRKSYADPVLDDKGKLITTDYIYSTQQWSLKQ